MIHVFNLNKFNKFETELKDYKACLWARRRGLATGRIEAHLGYIWPPGWDLNKPGLDEIHPLLKITEASLALWCSFGSSAANFHDEMAKAWNRIVKHISVCLFLC